MYVWIYIVYIKWLLGVCICFRNKDKGRTMLKELSNENTCVLGAVQTTDFYHGKMFELKVDIYSMLLGGNASTMA